MKILIVIGILAIVVKIFYRRMVEEYVEAEGDEAQEDANVDFVNELLSNKIT